MSKRKLYWRLFRAVMANPRFIYFAWRRDAYAQTAKRLAQGHIPQKGMFYPVKLDLRIVYACNLRCKMCAQWGDTGTYSDYSTPKLRQKLDLKVIESVVRELTPKGLKYVDMEGGETFLYPQIIELFRMLKSYGLFVKPVTNGTLLKKYARDVIESGVDSIQVSVDGGRETHNVVRQADWAYDRTMEGLQALVEERARTGKRKPLINISFTMTRHNKATALRQLCKELAGKGLIDVLVVKASPIWVPEERGQAYNALVEKHLGARGINSWRGFLEDYSDFVQRPTRLPTHFATSKHRTTTSSSLLCRRCHGMIFRGCTRTTVGTLGERTVPSPTSSPRSTVMAMSIRATSSLMSRYPWGT